VDFSTEKQINEEKRRLKKTAPEVAEESWSLGHLASS
jgi:hypothetical protein